ncbi:MAG TPA: ATP-binding cassette domain-containing protein [Thermoplasmata archaeon]|nr:ATP-binding cassette domain-containing protein [Thermoplasmata archaeon]
MSGEGLSVRGLSVRLGDAPVLESVDLDVPPGQTLVVLGPNGSGKTTLLRSIAGLQRPDSGRVRLAGRSLDSVPPHRRRVGLVSQEPSLFAHRTVAENIAYGPELQRRPAAEVDPTIRRLAGRLGLIPLLDRRPPTLSGGEQQRTALARALAAEPEALLLDEPFANIDPEFRSALRAEFRSTLLDEGVPVLHVTHDRDEGLFLADRLLLLLDGRVAAVGLPKEVLEHPTSGRAAAFLGYNLLPTDHGTVAVLPRNLRLAPPGAGTVSAVVRAVGAVEGGWELHGALDGGRPVQLRTGPELTPPARGSTVALAWDVEVPIE